MLLWDILLVGFQRGVSGNTSLSNTCMHLRLFPPVGTGDAVAVPMLSNRIDIASETIVPTLTSTSLYMKSFLPDTVCSQRRWSPPPMEAPRKLGAFTMFCPKSRH